MRSIQILAGAACLLCTIMAGTARAQSASWPERAWFGISGGVQPAGNRFNDAFDLTLYTENERITVDYPVKSGAVIAASGGVRVWKRLAIGAGFTRYAHSGRATVKASLPHPFFDNTFRNIEGTTDARRTENGAHLQLGWMMPLSPKLRLLLTAGPSVISVDQTVVTNVRFTETFPFDTAEFTGADVSNHARTATGFNAGADLWWMFGNKLGAGVLAQVTRARARLDAGNGRRISVDAGGAQIAAGLRVVF